MFAYKLGAVTLRCCTVQQKPRAEHTRNEGGHKNNDATVKCSQSGERPAGTKPGDTPTDTKDASTSQQTCVKVPILWNIESGLKHRSRPAEHETIANKGGGDGPTHDKRKAWIPCAENVKEVDDFGWVRHAGQRNSSAKKCTD